MRGVSNIWFYLVNFENSDRQRIFLGIEILSDLIKRLVAVLVLLLPLVLVRSQFGVWALPFVQFVMNKKKIKLIIC